MKTTFKFLSAFALAVFVLAGCSKDNDASGPDNNGGNGEKVTVRLTVVDANGAATRNAGTNEQAVIGNEATLNGLKVAVFDVTTNAFETQASVALDGSNVATTSFQVTAGNKRFYVFSGPAAFPTLGATTTTQAFETTEQTATYNASDVPSIASFVAGTPPSSVFANGTLWGDVTTAIPPASATSNEVDVKLEIGRAAAKIKVSEIAFAAGQDGSVLTGSFDLANATYRIGAAPYKYYLVGQYVGNNDPVSTAGVEVVSAVHNEAWGDYATPNDPSTAPEWSTAFRSNTSFTFKPINATVANESDFFYTVENTTAAFDGSGSNNLFYGNTTFVQVKVAYDPDTELMDADDPTAAGTPFVAGNDSGGDPRPAGTFWATLRNGEQIIFDNVPVVGNYDAGAPIYVYEGGVNYYKFPVSDPNETVAVAKYRTLRNHYYAMKVKNIKKLGSPTEDVYPNEPIPQDFDVTLEIEVLNWSKVEDDNIILQ